jgi:glycosyltransferase involved in cell wall biosynthesis
VKILFTCTHLTSFIQEDLNLLQKNFETKLLTTSGVGSVARIASEVRKTDATYTWFASVYSSVVVFFARVWRKKSIVVIGGVDVADYPEIGYGIWVSRWKALLVQYALRKAHCVLIVAPFQKEEAIRLAQYDGKNIEYVPTGYDPEEWFPAGEKEPTVLTVAKCENETRLKVKGVEMLLEAARELSHVRFVIIGLAEHLMKRLKATSPENIEFVPFVSRKALLSYYQRAKVYCQPSFTEGLPNSLCEAMLCECVPVGTNVGGIPTAIRDQQFLVPYGDVGRLVEALERALQAPASVAESSRKYIAETFPLNRREETLVRILHEMQH